MQVVNKKKPITLVNRTNYFIPDKDKVKVTFGSPATYMSREIKIEGYESRLYWQFKYCDEHDGQTFFYTLTYNEKSMPKQYGINCFDYEDLRELLTGGFRKKMLRKYGTIFKYFIGAELGDGKGKRGMHNNPHYHLLLFLEPAPLSMRPKNIRYEQVPDGFYNRNSKNHRKGDVRYKTVKISEPVSYVKISESEMTHLMRLYWQGVDQDDCPGKFFDYRDMNKGVVKEGDLGALVQDFRAIGYCAKYVTKDVKLVQHEPEVEKKLRKKYRSEYRYKDETYKGFFRDEINPMFNTPVNPKKKKWCFTDVQLINELTNGDEYHRKVYGTPLTTMDNEMYMPYVSSICSVHGLWPAFEAYVDRLVEPLVQAGINEWRNRYSNKCRVSHGLGDYALDFMDKTNPSVQVPDKNGYKNRPINLYYYRKMYCDVVKDPEGNNLYVLNQDGIEYKASTLPQRIRKTVSACMDYIPLVAGNRDLFNKMRDSDVNTEVTWTHRRFIAEINKLNKLGDNLQNILNRYAEYKLVYENRFLSYQTEGSDVDDVFPRIDVIADYKRFLVPSFYSVPRDDLRLACFLENPPENYLPYSQHPYFSRYIGLFHVLDLCSDYFFIQKDNKKQEDAEQRAVTKRFHSERKLKEFYAAFTR